jgi:hypothetical protein
MAEKITGKRLFELYENLNKRYLQLEARVAELERKRARSARKPVNGLQILNNENTPKPVISFDEFVTTQIEIKDEHIVFLQEKTCTYYAFIERVLNSIEFHHRVPIQCIKSQIYTFDGETYKDTNTLIFFENIKVKTLRSIMAWKKKNGDEKIDQDDASAIKFNNALIKVMNTNFQAESNLAVRIRRLVCKLWQFK